MQRKYNHREATRRTGQHRKHRKQTQHHTRQSPHKHRSKAIPTTTTTPTTQQAIPQRHNTRGPPFEATKEVPPPHRPSEDVQTETTKREEAENPMQQQMHRAPHQTPC
jgi:hypothetical protein